MIDKKNGVPNFSRVPNFEDSGILTDRFWKMVLQVLSIVDQRK